MSKKYRYKEKTFWKEKLMQSEIKTNMGMYTTPRFDIIAKLLNYTIFF